jgi:hypothetical protein
LKLQHRYIRQSVSANEDRLDFFTVPKSANHSRAVTSHMVVCNEVPFFGDDHTAADRLSFDLASFAVLRRDHLDADERRTNVIDGSFDGSAHLWFGLRGAGLLERRERHYGESQGSAFSPNTTCKENSHHFI